MVVMACHGRVQIACVVVGWFRSCEWPWGRSLQWAAAVLLALGCHNDGQWLD